MREPLVSVIINNYNYARFLGAAIDSALAQDYPAVEIVVVDDGSTDDSPSVIAAYGTRVVAHFQANQGQAAAMNAGFALSHGEVVIFLDADDVLSPGGVRSAARALADHGVSQAHALLPLIDDQGQPTGGTTPRGPLASGDVRDTFLRYGPWSIANTPTSGNAWARWMLDRIMPVPTEQYRLCADSYLLVLAPLLGRIAACDQPIAAYRVHSGNRYWQSSLRLHDLKVDLDVFAADSSNLALWADRLGLDFDSSRWGRRNWRHQVRRYTLWQAQELPARPESTAIFQAALVDQTHPAKKLVLLPLLALLLALPRRWAVPFGLQLLAR